MALADETYPDVLPGSTRSYMAWETVDPETWVPWGYACVRVDSRGAGRSPGTLDMFSPREVRDYYDAVEWAGTRAWSNGKVGLNGISYYAVNQWLVAAQQPPNLAAMIPWEGAADFYRDWARHGGIASNGFLETWYPRQILRVQHGNPDAPDDPYLDEPVSGPERLDASRLEAHRNDPLPNVLGRELDEEWYRDRSPDWTKVAVPFLSAASLAGYGLHPRGNFEAFTQAASKEKWLETHPGRHEEWFYLEYGLDLQRRFLDHYLKDVDNGWDREPRVQLHLRRPFTDAVTRREENEWPLERTAWTRLYLDAGTRELRWDPPVTESTCTFEALGEPVNFLSAPLERETELTGPLAARLFVSSSTEDADLFLTLQAFAPDGREVAFQGTIDPNTPLAQGWLRVSHRELDPDKSLPWRPYHAHQTLKKVRPDDVVNCEVEIWPTSIVLPAGYRIALQIGGRDFERPTGRDQNEAWISRGSGPWLHTHPKDRPPEVFGGRTTVHTGPVAACALTLPVIPTAQEVSP